MNLCNLRGPEIKILRHQNDQMQPVFWRHMVRISAGLLINFNEFLCDFHYCLDTKAKISQDRCLPHNFTSVFHDNLPVLYGAVHYQCKTLKHKSRQHSGKMSYSYLKCTRFESRGQPLLTRLATSSAAKSRWLPD